MLPAINDGKHSTELRSPIIRWGDRKRLGRSGLLCILKSQKLLSCMHKHFLQIHYKQTQRTSQRDICFDANYFTLILMQLECMISRTIYWSDQRLSRGDSVRYLHDIINNCGPSRSRAYYRKNIMVKGKQTRQSFGQSIRNYREGRKLSIRTGT